LAAVRSREDDGCVDPEGMHGSRPTFTTLPEVDSVQVSSGRFARLVQAGAGRLLVAIAIAIALFAIPSAAAAAPRHRSVRLSLHSTPAAVAVRQGHSVRSRIRAHVRNGSARAVWFHVSGLPRGVVATFRPRSVRPGHTAILTLTTSSSAPAGSYKLHVLATGIGARIRHHGRLAAQSASVAPSKRLMVRLSVRPDHSAGHGAGRGAGHGAGPGGTTGSTGPTSSADPTPGKVPTHVETWAYDDGCSGGNGASADLVRQWVTYAESSCGWEDTKALSDCQSDGTTYCTSVEYLDANRIYSQGSVPVAQSAQESWWLHEPGHSDAAHRISVSGYGGGNILNDANPAVDNWFQNFVQYHYNSYDALMMDDIGPTVSLQLYGSGYSSSDEITTNSGMVSAHDDMASAVTHTNGSRFLQIDNGISPNPNVVPPLAELNHPGTVTGLVAEGAPEDDGTMPAASWEYTTLLDEMSYVDHTANDFMVLLSYDQAGSVTARSVQAATALLGYSPGHTVSWSDLEQNNTDLAIWPEEGIYPTHPVQTMNEPSGKGCLTGTGQVCTGGGHTDLQVAPGVFRREFKQCYNRGAAIGPCATIVNANGSAVTVKRDWLTLPLHHQITLQGGDVQSGGTVNVTGAAFTPGTTIPGNDAVLLSS
jgi:hypothetical protein